MNEQMTIGDLMDTKIILKDELDEAEKKAKAYIQAKNKACFLIEDAKARYIKDKTRARSKKAAMEKDAILNSARFDKLKDYSRKNDILEAYGWDCITEKQCDELQELWDEREAIRNHVEDGRYTDMVTLALAEAWAHVEGLWDKEITEYEMMKKEFDKQRIDAENAAREWQRQQDEAYRKLTGG